MTGIDQKERILVNGEPIKYDALRFDGEPLLPDYMRGGMRRYMEQRIPPGHFLTAVLSNDLMEACRRADDVNRYRLFDYCSWLYSYAPVGSFGSAENVRHWLTNQAKEAG